MPYSINAISVPTGLSVPQPLREAQERLLARFNSGEPLAAPRLQAIVSSERSAVILAVLGVEGDVDWPNLTTEQFIGTLTLIGVETTTRLTGHIDHVVVDRAFEGRGIGELLVLKAIKVGELLGMSRLDLTSSPSKESAQKLYKNTGFQYRKTNNWRYEY